MTLNKDKNQSIKTDSELTQMLEVAEMDVKTAIRSVFQILEQLSRDIKEIKKTQTNFQR